MTQFTYFQQVGGIDCDPVCAEITYGLERLAMYVQDVEFVYDLAFNEQFPLRRSVSSERAEFSAYNFERADTDDPVPPFRGRGEGMQSADRGQNLALPAYDQCIKASHSFNLLDARGVISRDRTRGLYRPRARARESLLRSVACSRRWAPTSRGMADA